MTPVFLGQINEGKLLLDKSQQFKDYLHALNGKRVELTVEKLKHPRSQGQNRYYWGVVIHEVAKHTGHDPEQIHELLKQMFSPKWHYPNGGSLETLGIPTSTTRLDTLEFTEYTEKCRIWANEFLGLQIPLPGEVTV
jgi:hypothetical protein